MTATARRPRRIWLVADDYGISRSVNAAIRDLLAGGRINAASVMVVGHGFDQQEADRLAALRVQARLAIGVHLTLTAPFRPLGPGALATRAGTFAPLGRVLVAALLGRVDRAAAAAELRAQIAAFRSAFGRPPDFVDGHQHVHLLPGISAGVLAVIKDAAPQAWVRQCGRASGAPFDRKAVLLDLLSRRFRRHAAAAGVATNPAFAGTYQFRPQARFAELFPTFLDGLPDGGLIMCHPGLVDAELARCDALTTLREREYEFFRSEAYPAIMAAKNVALL